MDKRTCSVEGCDSPVWARGWCSKHLQKWRKYGDPLGCAKPAPETCEIPGCDGKRKAHGWCNAHYLQWRKEHVWRTDCSFPDCGRPVDSHGYCAGHARQFRAGDTLSPLRLRGAYPDGCLICGAEHVGRGLCSMHLQRLQDHGDPSHVRQPGDNPRKYTLDESFFDEITTEAQAYWLGFITADGNVLRNSHVSTLRVGLAIKDTAHLELMNACLGSNRPLVFWLKREHPAVVASFDSWRIVEGLWRLGIGPNKAGTVRPWDGPAGLMPHYWRGLFDGDGSIFRSGGCWGMSITGSEACVRAFGDWARAVCGSHAAPRLCRNRTWEWRTGGSQMPQRLAVALYDGATVYLDRKHALAGELISRVFPGVPRRASAA